MIEINGRLIGPQQPTYLIAELSANHSHDFDLAVKLIHASKSAGADAIKVQTYRPDTITLNCDSEPFHLRDTIWKGCTLYELYTKAYMPWEWQPKLQKVALDLGMDFFSTPFDNTAVDFLEELNVPAYKIASFEIVDLPLLRKVAATGKPIIMSTGMATLGEIEEAVATIRQAGGEQLALLKCTSAYPAKPEDMDLLTIPHLAATFSTPTGLSDHTLGNEGAIAAVAIGACIIEKHVTLSRDIEGPDSKFSLEPEEFAAMVASVRSCEKSLGKVRYGANENEIASRRFRRSLFVVKDVSKGEAFTEQNVRSIRPSDGLHTRHFNDIIGRIADRNIDAGTPLSWELVR